MAGSRQYLVFDEESINFNTTEAAAKQKERKGKNCEWCKINCNQAQIGGDLKPLCRLTHSASHSSCPEYCFIWLLCAVWIRQWCFVACCSGINPWRDGESYVTVTSESVTMTRHCGLLGWDRREQLLRLLRFPWLFSAFLILMKYFSVLILLKHPAMYP